MGSLERGCAVRVELQSWRSCDDHQGGVQVADAPVFGRFLVYYDFKVLRSEFLVLGLLEGVDERREVSEMHVHPEPTREKRHELPFLRM